MTATAAPRLPRLQQVACEALVTADGLVTIVQRDVDGSEQMLILERQQLRELLAWVDERFECYERRRRRAEARR